MTKIKKRPGKNAKAASKAIKNSKLLAASKAAHVSEKQLEFNSSDRNPIPTAGAHKSRPQKKRG